MSEYAERDICGDNGLGEHYCKHVDAMTAEGLHSKAAIAAELAWRDLQIKQLQSESWELAAKITLREDVIEQLQSELAEARDSLSSITRLFFIAIERLGGSIDINRSDLVESDNSAVIERVENIESGEIIYSTKRKLK